MVRRVVFVLLVVVAAVCAPAIADDGYFGDYPAEAVSSWVASPAEAVNLPESIESNTTFGLRKNEYDFIFEPAELGALKGWKRDRTIGNKWDPTVQQDNNWFLITNLGNNSSSDAYQIGAWGKLGPGNLALVAAYSKYKNEANDTYGYGYQDATGDTSANQIDEIFNGTESSPSKYERERLDLYLGYGFLLGERSSLGFSLRHIEQNYDPDDDSSSYSTVDTTFGFDDEGLPVSKLVRSESNMSTYMYKVDQSWDSLAVEYKMWPSAAWSFKLRGAYASVTTDAKFSQSGGEGFVQDQYYDLGEGDVWREYQRISSDDKDTLAEDLSWDGNEWSLGGRLDFYMSPESTLQFDLGYATGDFSLKSNMPYAENSSSYSKSMVDFEVDGTPTGLIDYETTTNVSNYNESQTADDITSDRLFVGAEYMWQFEQADFFIGLRYFSDKGEASFSGPRRSDYTHVDTVLTDPAGPDYTNLVYAVYTTGTASYTGSTEYTAIELPVAAELHVTDKLELRFGAMHVMYTDEFTGSDHWLWNFFEGDISVDGTSETHYVDALSTTQESAQASVKVDSSYTLYRAGLAYKFNDRVVAELMLSESSGSAPTGQEAVTTNSVVAGVSFKF